jgi:hypothetical protein
MTHAVRLSAVIGLFVATSLFAHAQSIAAPTKALGPEQLQVFAVEEQFRLARLRNDVKALDRLLADDYSGTNQNGKTRNKAELLELYKQFKTKSLVTSKPQILVHGDTAVVSGFQTEILLEPPSTPTRFRFVRVYIRQAGNWKLLASEQMTTTLD